MWRWSTANKRSNRHCLATIRYPVLILTHDGKKRCPRCGKFKLAVEHFYPSKAHGDGFGGYCKACGKREATQWRKDNPERSREIDRTRSNRDERTVRSLAALRRWGEQHAETMRQRRATWAARNPEKARARDERFRKKDAERLRQNRRTPEAREAGRIRVAARRAKCEAHAGLSAAQWQIIVEIFEGRCAYCCRSGTERKLTIDHFVPVARGGRHEPSNIVPACGPCNSSKNDSDPFDWMEARGVDGDLVVALICETRPAALLSAAPVN